MCVCVCVCVFPRFSATTCNKASNKRYLRLQRDIGETFIIVFSLIVHTYIHVHVRMYVIYSSIGTVKDERYENGIHIVHIAKCTN